LIATPRRFDLFVPFIGLQLYQRPGEGELLGTSQSRGPIVRYQSTAPPADATGNIEAFSLFAGQSAGLLQDIQRAGDIVREIADDARQALRRFSEVI
jgi:NAD(P)H-dependent flavin oxidoreductase YrpB (nitropropane dioxygenase family)